MNGFQMIFHFSWPVGSIFTESALEVFGVLNCFHILFQSLNIHWLPFSHMSSLTNTNINILGPLLITVVPILVISLLLLLLVWNEAVHLMRLWQGNFLRLSVTLSRGTELCGWKSARLSIARLRFYGSHFLYIIINALLNMRHRLQTFRRWRLSIRGSLC